MKKLVLFVPLLVFFLFEINLPYVGPFGNNNSTYALQAKNFVRHGYIKTFMGPLRNTGDSFPSKPVYYTNHPPLMQTLISISFRVFGQTWWAGRIVPILFSFVSVFLIGLLAKRIWGKSEQYSAILVSSSIPMLLVYGKLMQFEPILLPFMLSSTLFLFDFIKTKKTRYGILIILSILFGFLADWPMLLFAIIILAIYITEKGYKNKYCILYVLFFLILPILYFIYSYKLNGEEVLLRAYLTRSVDGAPISLPNPIISLLSVWITRFIIYLTPLGLVAVIILLKNNFRLKKYEIKNKILLGLIIFPTSYIILFPNGSWEHPYWMFYFLPITILALSRFISHNILASVSKKYILLVLLILNCIFGLLIFQLKRTQTNKALWQYAFIEEIRPYVINDQAIGTNWDFNDDLLRYVTDKPVLNITETQKIPEVLKKNPYGWNHYIFSCWTNCREEDYKVREQLLKSYKAVYYQKDNKAILFDIKVKPSKITSHIENTITQNDLSNKIINFYRRIRNFLGLEQI